ncbi:MAG: TlpA disulfide reductase family protein [Alphaproteobacteria bacterium]|nr:TlpA disulfide reductase family protein [Alphaproteobacteria bacterium]
MKKAFVSLCLAALLLAFRPLLAQAGEIGAVTYSFAPKPAPPLVFRDAEGTQHALSDYRGRYVLLHIWATWCPYCVGEMATLDALQGRTNPQRLTVIPLSEDHTDGAVGAFYRTHNITHLPVALDTAGRAPGAFKLPGLPSSVVIDPQGREVARLEGLTDWASPEAEDFLKNAMQVR